MASSEPRESNSLPLEIDLLLFCSFVTEMKHPLGENFHAVSFYEDTESLCASVVEFISEGIEAGQPALVIARPPHRAAILEALRDRGMDVDRLQAADDLIVLDARDTLAAFFTNGQLNTA